MQQRAVREVCPLLLPSSASKSCYNGYITSGVSEGEGEQEGGEGSWEESRRGGGREWARKGKRVGEEGEESGRGREESGRGRGREWARKGKRVGKKGEGAQAVSLGQTPFRTEGRGLRRGHRVTCHPGIQLVV